MYYPSRSGGVSSEGDGTVEKVGFVGLGIMGAAMARNLLAAGHDLVVHNRTRAKAEELTEHGANVADSPGRSPRRAA
jgi:3-hydroxyisobutyrate dehydrogenase-like beta-hydroxyacid dehydrogenase